MHRRAIPHRHESLRALAKRYGINPKGGGEQTGPREAKSTVIMVEKEAIIVAFRQHTLLLIVDCLYALQATIPNLTRASLHRCLSHAGSEKITEKTFRFVELHSTATRRVAADFLRNLADVVPSKINTILTGNGTHITDSAGGERSVSDIKATALDAFSSGLIWLKAMRE